jgi:hypothetical protein
MKKRTISVALMLVTTGVTAAGIQAASSEHFSASLTVAQTIPKPTHIPTSAAGRFAANLSGRQLRWTLSFSGITQRVTATYLDYGTKTETGAILVAICAPCKSSAHGTVKVTAADIKDIEGGRTYLNVETFQHPRGIIRGQIG